MISHKGKGILQIWISKYGHNTLVTEYIVGADGKVYPQINEDKKMMIQMHLEDAIQKKWRKLI